MAFGLVYGRDSDNEHPIWIFATNEGKRLNLGFVYRQRTLRTVQKEFDGILCDEIEAKLLGRSFDKWDSKDREEKAKLGGYEKHCPRSWEGARWASRDTS